MRLAIVGARFNSEITDVMFRRARRQAERRGADVVAERVPGTFEIPLALRRLLSRPDVDAGVAIGAVVKGKTGHDELIAAAVASELQRVMADTGKPIGLGVTGPGMTWEQGVARAERADAAVDAVIDALAARGGSSSPPPSRRYREGKRGPKGYKKRP